MSDAGPTLTFRNCVLRVSKLTARGMNLLPYSGPISILARRLQRKFLHYVLMQMGSIAAMRVLGAVRGRKEVVRRGEPLHKLCSFLIATTDLRRRSPRHSLQAKLRRHHLHYLVLMGLTAPRSLNRIMRHLGVLYCLLPPLVRTQISLLIQPVLTWPRALQAPQLPVAPRAPQLPKMVMFTPRLLWMPP